MRSGSFRVLLVEDNPADARLIQEMLADAGSGMDIEWVEELCPALHRLSSNATDVVLLDLSLPDSRGLDTFLKVREKTPEVPVVLLTGLDDEQVALQAVQNGAQDYLVKGRVDGDSLLRSIRYAIERNKLMKELASALAEIQTLKGLIPICAWCKKIRDDRGFWTQVEVYIKNRTGADFTHGICPECIEKINPEFYE
jgi:DNA-binding response OmpR family regulator